VSGNRSGLSVLAILYRLMSNLSLDWLNNVDCIAELTGRYVVLMCFFLKRFIAQRLCTMCTRINYVQCVQG